MRSITSNKIKQNNMLLSLWNLENGSQENTLRSLPAQTEETEGCASLLLPNQQILDDKSCKGRSMKLLLQSFQSTRERHFCYSLNNTDVQMKTARETPLYYSCLLGNYILMSPEQYHSLQSIQAAWISTYNVHIYDFLTVEVFKFGSMTAAQSDIQTHTQVQSTGFVKNCCEK